MTTQHAADIAKRIDNAHANFNETVRGIARCTEAEAKAVTAYYLKNRIAKLDIPSGRISVKHGAYLDADVLQRAIKTGRIGA